MNGMLVISVRVPAERAVRRLPAGAGLELVTRGAWAFEQWLLDDGKLRRGVLVQAMTNRAAVVRGWWEMGPATAVERCEALEPKADEERVRLAGVCFPTTPDAAELLRWSGVHLAVVDNRVVLQRRGVVEAELLNATSPAIGGMVGEAGAVERVERVVERGAERRETVVPLGLGEVRARLAV